MFRPYSAIIRLTNSGVSQGTYGGVYLWDPMVYNIAITFLELLVLFRKIINTKANTKANTIVNTMLNTKANTIVNITVNTIVNIIINTIVNTIINTK